MQSKSFARNAAVAGMIGAVLWIIGVIIHNGLGYSELVGSPNAPYQIFGEAGMIGVTIGLLGLAWGGAVKGRFGRVAVGLYVFGTILVDLGGLIFMVTGNIEALLFPIGGAFSVLGLILTGIAVVIDKSWSGWQRYVLPLFAVYNILFDIVPTIAGLQPDGPGMIQELVSGIFWFLIGLALYSSQRQRMTIPSASPAGDPAHP